MRTSGRWLSILMVLAIGVALMAAPATGRPAVRARTATRAIVHGRDAGVSQSKPTSFDLFGRRSRPAISARGASIVEGTRVPAVLSGFDGLADPFSFPSDTTGALGDSFYVVAVNTQVAVYDRTGVQVVAPIQLDTLHPDSLGRSSFDPKVIYDQYNDTFLVVYLVQEDSPRLSLIVTVAIPNATASNTGTWCPTAFPGDAFPASPQVWADYPGVGYNDTRVTITTNQFTFPVNTARFRYTQVMTIDKGGLYDCNQPAPVPTVFAGTQTRDDNGIQAFTLRPAETVGASPGPQLLVSFQCFPLAKCSGPPFAGKGSYLTLWRIKRTSSGFALKKGSLPTGRVALTPFGSQGGGGLNNIDFFWDAGDNRLINAFYDADRNELFAAHAVSRNLKPDTITGGYPEAVARWYEVDPGAKLKNSVLARKGIIGAAEVSVGWPSVASDSSGTLFVTYSRASDPHVEFLSAWFATIPPSSTAATQLLVHAGAATYDALNGFERWGDYTAINRDPLDGQNMATFNQYAASSAQWQQFISVVTDN
jgi:hypothetical protein